MKRALCTLATLCFLGLAAGSEAQREEAPYGISQVVVQHTECYGACPVDSLTVNADGRATYARFLGRGAVSRGGDFSRGTLSKEKFASMANFLQHLNFFELRPQYGSGNIDAADFIVSVTRNGRNYGVVIRDAPGSILQKKLEDALFIKDQIQWQRDEKASESGLLMGLRRPETREEASGRKKGERTDWRLPFATVMLKPLDHAGESLLARGDQEGQVQFFAVPGRYLLKATNENAADTLGINVPIYRAEQTVEIKPGPLKRLFVITKEVTLRSR